MTKTLQAVLLFLLCCSAYAAERTVPADAPPPATNTIGIVIFLVLFFGMCVGFFWYVWYNDKKSKNTQGKTQQ